MNEPARWEQAKEIFGDALARPAGERNAFVTAACATDPGLAENVLALLRAHEDAGAFIGLPALQGGVAIEPDGEEDDDTLVGANVGPYRVLDRIGRGGMGTVYRAVRADEQFEKEVALKVVCRGQDTDLILTRFKAERRILARLDHPGIARLLDGGTTADGRPYLVMEHVVGRRIDRYAAERGANVTVRLRLFRDVCAAVQYAHQSLVVHRDIKPANILVTTEGTPKLLDFGIAKLIDADSADAPTATDARVLTPEYASPEQVRGEPVTTASDVYSLGVLLFELLTGRKPYQPENRTPQAIARAVCEQEPPSPSRVAVDASGSGHATERLRRHLAGDLDTIVLMALRKEPGRRYASVEQLSDDLGRYLEGRPVKAQRDTLRYRAAKFVKRNRFAVAAVACIVLALVAGSITTAWQARKTQFERARAERRASDVRRLAGTLMFEVLDSIRDLPGSTKAQNLLVTQSLQYLDALASDTTGDPSLQREVADAYQRLGNVQGRGTPNLGDIPGAIASFRKAIVLYTGLNAAFPRDAAVMSESVECHQDLGALLWFHEHDAKQALEQLAIARRVAEAATALAPDDERLQRRLIVVEGGIGDVEIRNGNLTAAVAAFEHAVARGEAAVTRWPDAVMLRGSLAQSYEMLANALAAERNLPRALQLYERARVSLEALVAAQPTSVKFRTVLAGTLHGMTVPLMRAERWPEAVAAAERSLAVMKEIAGADADDQNARRNVVAGQSLACEALTGSPEPTRALLRCRDAVRDAEAVVASHPESLIGRQDLAGAFLRQSQALRKSGDTAGALAAGLAGLSNAEVVQRAHPEGLEGKIWVAALRSAIGDALAEHDPDGACDAYRVAASIWEGAVAEDPQNLEAQEDLLRLYLAMDRLFVRRVARAAPAGRVRERQELLSVQRKALAAWKTLDRSRAVPPSLVSEQQRLEHAVASASY